MEGTRRGRAPNPWPTIGIAASLVLVAGSIGLGLHLPGSGLFRDYDAGAALDYSTRDHDEFPPLSSRFIEVALGARLGDALTPTGMSRRTGAPRPEVPFVEAPTAVEHRFTNDDMADAQTVGSLPFTARTDSAEAGREAGEPADCGGAGGTAWYRYRSPKAQEVIANTFGTGYPAVLGVYRRSDDGAMRLLGCDSDATGNAHHQFGAEPGATYLFQIAAQAAGGRLEFTLEPEGMTSLISRSSSGRGGARDSLEPSISDDGRFVAFSSWATDLAPGTPQKPCLATTPPLSVEEAYFDSWDAFCEHVYVADRVTGRIRLASVSSAGEPATHHSDMPWISGDGRFVAFRSTGDNLVENDTNRAADVFVRDLSTGRTERVSISSRGEQATAAPSIELFVSSPSLSADGRFVAFASNASNLVAGDTNDLPDAFVHDRLTRRTERVSVSSTGAQAELNRHMVAATLIGGGNYMGGESMGRLRPSISPDGRSVLFFSAASNLVAGDTNDAEDLFLHVRFTGNTELVSVSMTGGPADGPTSPPRLGRPQISADGRYVVLTSSASNLVPGDTYGMQDVFVRDRLLRKTVRVSVSSAGDQADQASFDGAISPGGRYVVFVSNARNLTPGTRSPQAPVWDLFVHDLVTSTTTRIAAAPSGSSGAEARIESPGISADGRVTVYTSWCFDFCAPAPSTLQVWAHERVTKQP